MTDIDIRVLRTPAIEDYHAHLLRLDPRGRSLYLANNNHDQGIDSHCLWLLATQAILIGGYVDGTLRASLEIVPDRTARQANAVFTAETAFGSSKLTALLLARLIGEARDYRLSEIKLHGIDEASLLSGAGFATGVDILGGAPLRLRFAADMPTVAAAPWLTDAVSPLSLREAGNALHAPAG